MFLPLPLFDYFIIINDTLLLSLVIIGYYSDFPFNSSYMLILNFNLNQF